METQNDRMWARSEKLTILLRSFEDYVNEVVTSNHGMKPDEMRRIVLDNFRRSIQANFDYHAEMARLNEKDKDTANAAYHNVMADVYKSLLK